MFLISLDGMPSYNRRPWDASPARSMPSPALSQLRSPEAAAGGGRPDGAAEAAEAPSGAVDRAWAAAQSHGTLLWAFLHGFSMVPQGLLALVPPLLLQTLFSELRPAAAAAGAAAEARLPGVGAGLVRAAAAALGARATLQAGRPLWDARAAALLLLMGRCMHDGAAMDAIGGGAFFAGLLADSDPRVRHYASGFVLRLLMARRPAAYRRALRAVVARAQQANDERLLSSPALQVQTMLDLALVDLAF